MTINRTHFLPAQVPDGDFPVQLSETCSVPSERMAYLLAGLLETNGSVLEIGTGSGYQTAVLAELCRDVCSIEIFLIPGVAAKLPSNVALIVADGFTFDTGQRFDGIVVTCATMFLCPVWCAQLKEGARLVVPVRIGNSCRISVYIRRGEQLELDDVYAYAPFTDAVHSSN